jgi:hypothetical protein
MFMLVALGLTLVWASLARADVSYRADISGVEDSDLADLLDKVSELKTLEDKPPVSEEALRRRAERRRLPSIGPISACRRACRPMLSS